MKGIRFGAAILSLVALAASGCGEFLTSAELTQTAEPAAAAPAETASATPAETASATPATEATATVTPAAGPATPEPAPTLEDEPTNVPDRRGHLPTPSSDSEAMFLSGWIYVDGRPASGNLVPFIDGQACGKGQSGRTEDRAWFTVMVTAAAEEPGCGIPGATVSFTMNGNAVNETVVWKPGFQEDAAVALSAGPAPALYRGTFSLVAGFKSDLPGAGPSLLVTPFVDGLACGEADAAVLNPQDHARFAYRVVVLPDALQAGCGRAGASVVLRLQVEGGSAADIATVPWQTLPLVAVPNVDLRSVIPLPPAEAAQ